MGESIDEKDEKVLEIMKENSSLSTHKISKKILIPISTINNRIKKLKKNGVIKKYTIDIDQSKLGFDLEAYVLVTVSLAEFKREKIKMKDLISTIKKNPIVESAENLSGDVDIIIKVRGKNIDELNEYVVNVLSYYKGIEKTKTAIILKHN